MSIIVRVKPSQDSRQTTYLLRQMTRVFGGGPDDGDGGIVDCFIVVIDVDAGLLDFEPPPSPAPFSSCSVVVDDFFFLAIAHGRKAIIQGLHMLQCKKRINTRASVISNMGHYLRELEIIYQ